MKVLQIQIFNVILYAIKKLRTWKSKKTRKRIARTEFIGSYPDVFQWIKKTSIGLFHFILKTLRFGFQYFWIITLCTFIALVVGFFCTKPSQVKVEGRSTLLFAPENRANVYNNLKVIQAYCGDLKVLPQL